MKKQLLPVLAAVLLLSAVCPVRATTPVRVPDLSEKSGVAPLWFGPNAFPIPEISDGRVKDRLTVELAGDYYKGHLVSGQDDTFDLFLRAWIPLFSPRVNLSLWMPVVETWRYDASVREARRILSDPDGDPGWGSGDVYVSLDIQVLTETERRPALMVRSVLKTASANCFGYARDYDSPGYFFDATAGKGFGRFRLSATTGFLCWQTGTGRQNDAVQYGLGAFYDGQVVHVAAQWGGYIGWERYGDAPMSARLRIGFAAGRLEPFIQCQQGLRDYPFTQFRLGCAWGF
jgi:hypothetical protein